MLLSKLPDQKQDHPPKFLSLSLLLPVQRAHRAFLRGKQTMEKLNLPHDDDEAIYHQVAQYLGLLKMGHLLASFYTFASRGKSGLARGLQCLSSLLGLQKSLHCPIDLSSNIRLVHLGPWWKRRFTIGSGVRHKGRAKPSPSLAA